MDELEAERRADELVAQANEAAADLWIEVGGGTDLIFNADVRRMMAMAWLAGRGEGMRVVHQIAQDTFGTAVEQAS